jgi:RNA polymerase sigma factor (TIGR02999 family)
MSETTRILNAIQQGDPAAADQLLPLVYDELRRLAAAKLANEKPGHTLQATALVHEAYIRLVDQNSPQQWDGSRHFFAAAAEAMRRILIERARRQQSLKGGGGHERVALQANEPCVLPMACDDLLGLDEAIRKLEQRDPRKAELVKLRFFAGLTTVQAANALGVSVSTAENDWTYARCWLRLEMGGEKPRDSRKIR